MKRIMKYFSIGLLVASKVLEGSCCDTSCSNQSNQNLHTSFVVMTCGQNLYTQYHKLLFPEGSDYGDMEYEDNCGGCKIVADLSATYRYIQSRNGSSIANYLWGTDTLTFQGGDVASGVDRSGNALVSEYFGLATDSDLSTTLSPRLRNQVLDFQLELSGEKLWAQVNLPLMWSKWQVNKGCAAPNVQGSFGTGYVDYGQVDLVYTLPGTIAAGNNGTVSVNTTALGPVTINGAANSLYFDGSGNSAVSPSETNSIVSALEFAGAITATSINGTDVSNEPDLTYIDTVDATTGAQATAKGELQLGTIPMGTYGAYSNDAPSEYTGVLSMSANVADVASMTDLSKALAGNTPYGVFAGRKLNNFNFEPCSQFGLADIPIMLGYDFCKSDAYHLGLYLKFVIPTGTKIDSCFLENVLTPVIGNGRHFEFGIGASAHANFMVCDTSAWAIMADGYITRMFGANQTRTFDLPGQPMSRYALAFPVTMDSTNSYSVDSSTMVAIGDVNLYSGNVTANRGELVVDLIYSNCNWEVGGGYALAAESAQQMSCDSCSTSNNLNNGSFTSPVVTGYGIVGQTLQNTVGVGTILPANTDYSNGYVSVALTGTSPFQVPVQFFNLGATNQVAEIADGDSAGYSYGTPGVADAQNLVNVGDFSGNCSGLMGRQVLNRIFGHIDYIWRDCAWQPEIGVVGSIGFSPCNSLTAAYWDVGGRVGFAF